MQRSIDSFFIKGAPVKKQETPKATKRKIVDSSDEEKPNYEKKTRSNVSPRAATNKSPQKQERSPRKKVDLSKLSVTENKKSEHDRKSTKRTDSTMSPISKKDGKVSKTPDTKTDKTNKESKVQVNTTDSPVSSKKKKPAKTPDISVKVAKKSDAKEEGAEKKHTPKRGNAANFFAFQNRPSVLNPGSKLIPKGSPGCLNGGSFLVTGVLESLERDECNNYIQGLGGKIFKTVGKSLKYLIVGQEAGPRKLEDAKKYGIEILSEDDLFNLVRQKSTCKDEVYELNPAQMEDDEEICAVIDTPEILEIMKKETQQEAPNGSMRNGSNGTEKKPTSNVPDGVETVEFKPLVEKYKPISLKEIIGQQGAASNVAKLKTWLSNWFTNNAGKTNGKKASGWSGSNDGRNYRAALLSGPPGVGKTTTAVLVCKELQFDVIEMNASDTRNKRLLKEEVHELLSNRTLQSYAHGGKAVTKKHVLIMDEVDGMAGNEDRGGMQELIGFIKESSVPIICICNDRNHQKMRSLVNYCFDLRFSKPSIVQIKGRLLSICCREKNKS